MSELEGCESHIFLLISLGSTLFFTHFFAVVTPPAVVAVAGPAAPTVVIAPTVVVAPPVAVAVAVAACASRNRKSQSALYSTNMSKTWCKMLCQK